MIAVYWGCKPAKEQIFMEIRGTEGGKVQKRGKKILDASSVLRMKTFRFKKNLWLKTDVRTNGANCIKTQLIFTIINTIFQKQSSNFVGIGCGSGIGCWYGVVLSPREAHSNRKETKWQRVNRLQRKASLTWAASLQYPAQLYL